MQTLDGTQGSYVLSNKLGGKGKYGGVWTGTRTSDNVPVTVKRLEKYSSTLPEIMRRLSQLDHPNIAKVLDAFVAPDGCLYIVRQYIQGTDLKHVLTQKNIYRKVDEQCFVEAAKAVLRGLQAVHELGVIHRDIKPSNVVIRHNEGENPHEADFTTATLIDFEQAMLYPNPGNPSSSFALIYSPPEMLLKHNHLIAPASDLFALGTTLYHLVMGKTPYSDCNPEILVNLQLTYPMKQPARMDDKLLSVLAKAAYKEPFRLPPRRLTAEEVEQTLQLGIAKRYQTAAEMLGELGEVQQPIKKINWLLRALTN